MKTYEEAIKDAVDLYTYIVEYKSTEIDRHEFHGFCWAIARIYGKRRTEVREEVVAAYEASSK